MKTMSLFVRAAFSIPRAMARKRCFSSSVARSPLAAGAAKELSNFPPRLQHAKLAVRIDLRDQNSLARQDGDEALERKLLQRFPDRCAPDPERGRKRLLRQDLPGL